MWAFLVAQTKEHRFDPQVRRISLRKEWLLIPAFLPGEFHDRGAWWATVHGVTKSWIQLRNQNFIWMYVCVCV